MIHLLKLTWHSTKGGLADDFLFELGDFRGAIIWSWCSRNFHWRLRTADCSASQINFHYSSRRTWVAPTWSRLNIFHHIFVHPEIELKIRVQYFFWSFMDIDGSMCSMGPSHIAIMPPPISGPNASSPWDKQKRSAIVPVLVETTKNEAAGASSRPNCCCFFKLVCNRS